MLGNLLLSDIQGSRDEFEKHLAGPDGEMWLKKFKKFLRKENPWERSVIKPFPLGSIISLEPKIIEMDESSRCKNELDLSKVQVVSPLKLNESWATGEILLKRLKKRRFTLLDVRFYFSLIMN